MTGLDAAQRAGLERLIVRARSVLEQDLEAQAEGRYGINSDGTVEDEAALHLDPSALADRREIVAVVEHLRNEGETITGAVARLIREATFTHLNRLVAIRVAEAVGLVPPSLAQGRASQGFREVLEVAPLLAGDETGGYWTYLRLCGDEMASDAPVLFDPRNPLLTLSPGVAALDELVTLFSDPAASEIWTASDTFGWAYQFFNTTDERRQMRDESAAPRNSRELAVRNQFFTPRYVVDFLVQNTLGRRLLEVQPDSALIDALPLLVDPPTEPGEPLRLDDVRILDPACGSGHFLLGCYDLLERAWQFQGVEPADSAPLIVPALWGIDIDPRCAQVASAAIVFRARRHCRDLPLPRPNVITARALPDGSDSWEDILASLPSDRRELVQRMRVALAQAPVLGPLLKVEEQLDAEIRRHFTGSELAEGTLAEGIAPDAFGEVESEVLGALQRAADSAASSAAERLLAAEASDSIRFVDAARQRYDVVLMNPPFGSAVPGSARYLQTAYGAAAGELAAAFIARGVELCRLGGHVGVVATRLIMFLDRLEGWRRQYLLGDSRLTVLADLGIGVLQGALVEICAATIAAPRESGTATAHFLDLLNVRDKESALSTLSAPSVEADLALFAALPDATVPYWLSERTLAVLGAGGLRSAGLRATKGPDTGDDFRYLRLEWEVPLGLRSPDDGCVRIAKGGEYQPLWDDIHLVVRWNALPRRPRDVRAFLQGGLTYPYRTASDHSLRVLPSGVAYSSGGNGLFGTRAALLLLLGACYTRPYKILVEALMGGGDSSVGGSAARNYRAPALNSLPPLVQADHQLASLVRDALDSAVRRSEAKETSTLFVSPFVLSTSTIASIDDVVSARRRVLIAFARDQLAASIAVEDQYGRETGITLIQCDELWGSHPERLSENDVSPEAVWDLWKRSENELIDMATSSSGASRATVKKSFFADRRLELIARILDTRASLVADALDESAATERERRDVALDLVSYLVGVAVGRFDHEVALEPSAARFDGDIFDGLPDWPPGLRGRESSNDWDLHGNRRTWPATLLLDEAGHDLNLGHLVREIAGVLFPQSDEVVAEVETLLNRLLEEYLRREFFRDHLQRYSMSRRSAPIYWMLQVPSRLWGLWIYAPELSRETLFAVGGEAARREALAAEAIRRLRAERDSAAPARSVREVNEALALEETLLAELGAFRTEAERIAGVGWAPDLDDGMLLCAAPLADLFPAWSDAGRARERIRDGQYPWATVSRWKEVL